MFGPIAGPQELEEYLRDDLEEAAPREAEQMFAPTCAFSQWNTRAWARNRLRRRRQGKTVDVELAS